MSFPVKRYNKLLLVLFIINLGIIVSQDDRCTSIEHCLKCPDYGKCQSCEEGFTLNFEQTIYNTLKELAVPEKQY